MSNSISSMTGYGRAVKRFTTREITVEIKSVNHRYFDFSVRAPRAYGFLEEKFKKLTQEYVQRGKIDFYCSIVKTGEDNVVLNVNNDLAENYINAVKKISSDFGIENDLTASAMLRIPDVITLSKEEEDVEVVWSEAREVACLALESFKAMRESEGVRLCRDLADKIDGVGRMVEQIESLSKDTVSNYRQRLYAKIKETLDNRDIDDARVLQEVAIFADKVAVDEETVRLKSHFKQFKELLELGGAAGRKLDFLTQELNREINTIGSKCNDVEITKIVVDAKSEIEKIREQIQNIE